MGNSTSTTTTTIEDKSNNYCTGCSVCAVICPTKAIEYSLNKYGFYEAVINKEKCINCGKCKKVCPKYDTKDSISLETGKLYSARTKDETALKSCTSGGIAYEIAKYGIKKGYLIFGTIYDYNENIAKAVIIEDEKELEALKGSKYIQSDTKKAVEELIEKCKQNKDNKFIIFGTPCQIAGISKIIKNERIENEIVKVDLFCHGVPSYIVWKKYIEELKEKYKIEKIDKCIFRSKHYGWHNFCIEIKQKNEKERFISSEKSNFYKIFFDNMFLNFSCYDCEVRKNISYADIRLGDFWGRKYYNDLKGISAVLIMTDIGRSILKALDKDIEIIEECKLEDCFTSQSLDKYKNIDFNNKMINILEEKHSLKTIIHTYRRKMSLKQKVKLNLKACMGRVSPKCKYNLKKIYYKIKK